LFGLQICSTLFHLVFLYSKCTGVTIDTTEAQQMRETLERICFQTKDVLKSMEADTGHPTMALNVDGGMSINDTFLKVLTNVCRLPVGKFEYKHFYKSKS